MTRLGRRIENSNDNIMTFGKQRHPSGFTYDNPPSGANLSVSPPGFTYDIQSIKNVSGIIMIISRVSLSGFFQTETQMNEIYVFITLNLL